MQQEHLIIVGLLLVILYLTTKKCDKCGVEGFNLYGRPDNSSPMYRE